MKVKKMISMLLVGVMAFGLLAGCSRGAEENQADETGQETQSGTDTVEDAADEESEEGAGTSAGVSGNGNILVVYYSATGNTEDVAKTIAEASGADLFELEPNEPYSDADLDWTDENSRVSVEHENEDEREVALVADTVENWDSYDTVFIGYPIWWGIAAWPVDTFIKANDFTEKTVIPFCTSSSSDLGESGKLLADMAGTGEWQDGERFQSSVSAADVQDWVKGLGY